MKQKTYGFTVIEIALVLAIAGLIFLMAFIALPSLWASQRDADRKTDVMELITSLKNYQTNNSRGALPVLTGSGPEKFTWTEAQNDSSANTWKAFVREYVSKDFEDASGYEYSFYVVKCLNSGGGELTTGQTCAFQPGIFGNVNSEGNVNLGGGMDYTMYVAIGAACDGDRAVKTNSPRSAAAVYVLERAGRYCYNT